MVGGGGGGRAEVYGGEEDVVGLGVEAHGFGAEFGFDDFGFVCASDEDGACAIGDGEFWAAAEVYGADYAAALGVNHRGAVGIAVHDEDALGRGIVQDAIGVLVGFGFAGDLESLQIEDDDF